MNVVISPYFFGSITFETLTFSGAFFTGTNIFDSTTIGLIVLSVTGTKLLPLIAITFGGVVPFGAGNGTL